MLTTIKVTDRNIKKGHKGDCFYCAVALAINPLLKGDVHAGVDDDTIDIFEKMPNDAGRCLEVIRTPAKAAAFVRQYDKDETVRPFSFQLDIPDQYLKANGK